jgi:ATP-dependent RNA helicase SUPV3L1/SUV3
MSALERAAGPITAALGPTNTGKTHLAIERMLAHSSGMIGLPLRLLAREVYDRVVRAKGEGAAALITGEEKIVPKSARYFICTAESMPVSKQVAFMAIDEVQLAADPERGHIFTDRLLRARGREETMLLGAATMTGLIRELVPDAEIVGRERFSRLSYAGPAKLTALPRRSAIVAFSAESVYAIAELLRRRRGGAAVVMGSLSPRTRNAQVALYQSGEVDFLVATDAIGMGLNMEIEHVAFAESRKFDGRKMRRLTPAELSQIAGRAGRFRTDGSFGETAECRPFDPDVVEAIESHTFAPVHKLYWRNPLLDESSIEALQYSLGKPPFHPALERVREASDEAALGVLASDPDIRERATSPGMVARLWEVCRLPDFRKATLDAHARLVKSIYMHLAEGRGRLPDTYMAGHLEKLNKTTGDVDALAARLSYVRTWAYAANRTDWTHNPNYWRAETRQIEDKLSDALHERLMQRFVDRRTSALVKGLRDEKDLLAGVSKTGEVTVEGHYVGRLQGLVFQPDADGRELAARALRSAALKALRPEVNRRLAMLATPKAEDLNLTAAGIIEWEERPVAKLRPGPSVLRPGLALTGGELGTAEAQAAARKGLEDFVHTRTDTLLAPLMALKTGAEDEATPGPVRGVAWRLYEAGGALPRHEIVEEIKALDPDMRRVLRGFGVRIGQHMIYLPALVKPAPAAHFALLRAIHEDRGEAVVLPEPGLTSMANDKSRTRADYAAIGFQTCGPRVVRFDMLERLADVIREARPEPKKPAFDLKAEMTALLGCSVEDLRGVLSALGYKRVKKGEDEEKLAGEVWGPRRRGPAGGRPARPAQGADQKRGPKSAKREPGAGSGKRDNRPRPQNHVEQEPIKPEDSPFAALAQLKLDEKPSKPKRKRRKKPAKAQPDTAANGAENSAVSEDKPAGNNPSPESTETAAPAAASTPDAAGEA